MTGQLDYYSILGVSKTAGKDEIRTSYRKLAFRYHPDHNDDPGAADMMKQINEAYAVLSDDVKRSNYDSMKDQYGDTAYTHFRNSYTDNDIFSGSDINKIFEELAKDFGFRGFDDLFKEFYGAGYKAFNFKKNGISVKGMIFSMPGFFSKPFSEKNDNLSEPFPGPAQMIGSVFKKLTGLNAVQNGKDVLDTIKLSKNLAMNGGPFPYEVKANNAKLMVKIPPGIREGQKIRLSRMGKPGKNGGDPGDLYLKVAIEKTLIESARHTVSTLKTMFSAK